MCGPAAILPLTIASTAVSAGSQIFGGLQESAAARYEAAAAAQSRNLELASRNDAMERGQFDLRRHWRRVSQSYGDQLSAQAASGVDTTFGSSADLLGDVMTIGGEDAQVIADNTRKEVTSYDINANNYLMRERAAKSKARGALIGAALGVTGTILGGATKISELNNPSRARG